MQDRFIEISLASHALAAILFLALSGLILFAPRRSRPGIMMLAACALSTIWAAATAYGAIADSKFAFVSQTLEIARSAAWLIFLAGLAFPAAHWFHTVGRQGMVRILFGICLLGMVVLESLVTTIETERLPHAFLTVDLAAHLTLAVLGLVLLENIFRNSSQEGLWGLKHLIIGVGTIFVFDFFLYASALLTGQVDDSLYAARGVVNAFAVPLLAVAAGRNRAWAIDIHVSRDAVFHTATVIACGLYLVSMAGVGFYLRQAGAEWGAFLQILFFAAAVVILLVALFSGALRSSLRVFINKHFYSYRYDYRVEWQRFIEAMAESDDRLHDRAIRVMAAIVDSPAGAIWSRPRRGEAYQPTASWNFPDHLSHLAMDAPLIELLRKGDWIINLQDPKMQSTAEYAEYLPPWLADLPKSWLIVPLLHRDDVEGFAVLSEPRAAQSLNWEAYDLLRTIGRQVAGYLAEETAFQTLLDTRNLEQFNRRFAFVVHDIKNMAGQLSLLLSNAKRHGDNPEFQKDLLRTIDNTVGKLNNLLGQLRGDDVANVEKGSPKSAAPSNTLRPLLLAPIIRQILTPWMNASPSLELQINDDGIMALADETRLSAVIGHLVQNAAEAVGEGGHVWLTLYREADAVVLEIQDDGPGMDPDFVRNQLFRPLRTTKGGGFGIGAYQTRELVKEMKGTLEIQSKLGEGTSARVMLRGVDMNARSPAVSNAVEQDA